MIFVTGCYAQLKKNEIEEIEGVTCVFGATEKSRIVPTILSMAKGEEPGDRSAPVFFPAYSSGERTRSFLKVQDGCDYKCHYCTVPYARGESRNIPISQIIPQAEAIASEGIKEIVLTGVNTGDFGKSTGETFFDLIRQLNEVEGIERYRTCTSRGNPGFPASTRERPRETFFNTSRGQSPSHGSGAMTRSPSPLAWRPDFPGAPREAH